MPMIPAFYATAGKVRAIAKDRSHNQPGDPARLADVRVALARAADPPVCLPLGSDTVVAIEKMHVADAGIPQQWRAVSLSADWVPEGPSSCP